MPFLPLTIVLSFLKGTPKTAQKLPVRQDNPNCNSQQCLSATQLAHNEAEMPSDGLVRSKKRPGYAKMAPKQPENRLVLQKNAPDAWLHSDSLNMLQKVCTSCLSAMLSQRGGSSTYIHVYIYMYIYLSLSFMGISSAAPQSVQTSGFGCFGHPPTPESRSYHLFYDFASPETV